MLILFIQGPHVETYCSKPHQPTRPCRGFNVHAESKWRITQSPSLYGIKRLEFWHFSKFNLRNAFSQLCIFLLCLYALQENPLQVSICPMTPSASLQNRHYPHPPPPPSWWRRAGKKPRIPSSPCGRGECSQVRKNKETSPNNQSVDVSSRPTNSSAVSAGVGKGRQPSNLTS